MLKQQLEPFQIGEIVFTFDPTLINNALTALDRQFLERGFPRPGLYTVGCSVLFDGTLDCRSDVSHVVQGIQEAEEEQSFLASLVLSGTFSSHSSATFFVPRAPAGKRVRTARLRVFGVAVGSPEDVPLNIRLNGKPPVSTDRLNCFKTSITFSCLGTFIWDFTEEVRTIAASGGGEFPIVPDPLRPFQGEAVFDGTSIKVSTAEFRYLLAINYPWRHGGPDEALTLTFEEACPKKLELVLDPEPPTPAQPSRLPGGLPGIATEVKVDARVTTCPPQPGNPPESVVVTFMVDPSEPVQGSADAGGHFHNGVRPKGSFERPGEPEIATVMCTVSRFDDQGVGTCDEPKTYFPPEVSGNVKIVAEAKDFEKAEKKVPVQVPGLRPMPASGIGTWRLTGTTGSHPANHFGTPETVVRIGVMATDYFERFGESIGVNDMSLVWGGLFDIGDNWRSKPGHSRHRVGKSVDIDRCAQRLVRQDRLDKFAADYSGTRIVETPLGPPPCPGPVDTPRIHYDFP